MSVMTRGMVKRGWGRLHFCFICLLRRSQSLCLCEKHPFLFISLPGHSHCNHTVMLTFVILLSYIDIYIDVDMH